VAGPYRIHTGFRRTHPIILLMSSCYLKMLTAQDLCHDYLGDLCWKTGLSDGISAKSLGSGAVGIFIIDEYIN
jgi:hypothetical protein